MKEKDFGLRVRALLLAHCKDGRTVRGLATTVKDFRSEFEYQSQSEISDISEMLFQKHTKSNEISEISEIWGVRR